MKALLTESGEFERLIDDSSESDPTRTRTWVPTERPPVLANEVLVELAPLIDEITATQQWTTRPKTDAEAQKVASQLTLWKRLSAPERRALWNLADTEGPAGDAALLVLGAMWSAVETESRNPETKQLLGAAMQLGVVADVARARVILDDPGFLLE